MRHAMILPLLLAGCALLGTTPDQDLRLAQTTYTELVAHFADLREAGKISDDDYRAIESARVVARAALDEWSASLSAGRPFDATALWGPALAALLEWQARLR